MTTMENPKTEDFLDMLINALAARVKDKIINDMNDHIRNEVRQQISDVEASEIDGFQDAIERFLGRQELKVNVDNVEGLEEFISDAFREQSRDFEVNADNVNDIDDRIDERVKETFSNGDLKIEADAVEDLEEFIKDILKGATISIDVV